MIEEISSGGVVVFGNTVLLLKKFNGDWVLPKGRVEEGESLKEAALREVFEESGVKGQVIEYIDKVEYEFKNFKEGKTVHKTVHWFLMKATSMDCVPQKREGFIDAVFVHEDKVAELVRYEDERSIILKGSDML